ncbi:MAG TPA: NADH-quinone oxidoreductase subunit J [Tepidisphaeraceae bacterium]|jgi:NADH-quinone oxidoreductase subunit J|nr:NADH-quinone oxidoreductase subunit J [Tepidisphaeraceae bacterium]
MLAETTSVLSPLVILVLCVVAGVGTVLLLPSRREASLRKVGGCVLLATGLILAALLFRLTAGSPQGGMGPYFWIFSAIAIIGAIRVVTHPKPVYSALYFVLTVFASAGLFLLLWAEFMAVALVLIYAGAILVTYVFVIMLAAEAAQPGTGARNLTEHDRLSRDPVIAAAVGFALMGVMLFVIFDKANEIKTNPVEIQQTIVSGATQELGVFLFQKHLVNVELAGLILTVSMIGAIVIARRRVIGEAGSSSPDMLIAPATPVDDNPHSIPVVGTRNPRQKEYPET